jgi:hypothetical protein
LWLESFEVKNLEVLSGRDRDLVAGDAIFVSSDGLVFDHEHRRALDAAPGHSGHASTGERMLDTNLIDFELTFPRAGDYRCGSR